ncbi:hypothetical protein BDN72DRAFT_843613 [Pluteus cervinus]|uniref:Uncharacterized protein n=1 Tax=Pluteus cervinus TaxID=181527 RepID=A0ACD3AMZ8_9AGAR|nr:hypothetical protein BDN72DRAFT_843613 [Pluteus cervinus]
MTEVQTVKSSTISFFDLPIEIIEQILPEIEHHRDLINFACTSQLSSQLVIPHHTEYRILRLGTSSSAHIWTHLARRPDLACNIREIDIELHAARPPREPSALIEDVDFEERTWEVREDEIARALGYMRRLKSFAWEHRSLSPTFPGPNERHFAPVVLDTLQKIGTVEHLYLDMDHWFKFNEPIEECGLWRMSQLHSLALRGTYEAEDWPSRSTRNAMVLVNWLNSLTSLEVLRLPWGMFEEHQTLLFFPKLRYLNIQYTESTAVVLDFLERHPTLQDLTWYSNWNFPAPSQLPSNFLPELRRFEGRYDFFEVLASRTEINGDLIPIRKFESLILHWMDEDDYFDKLCACPGIDHQALRILSLANDYWNIHELAVAFPMIEELYLPPGPVFDFESFLSGIEQFKHLKILYRSLVWTDLAIETGGVPADLQDPELQSIVNERIQALARRCPSLTQIGHPKATDWYIEIYREESGQISSRNEFVFQRPLCSRFEMDSYWLWDP